METLFFILSSTALGYLVQGQEKLKTDIYELKNELAEIKTALPKRRSDRQTDPS